MVLRHAVRSDAEALSRIYNHYVRETIVTFEEDPVTAPEMTQRLDDARALDLPWLVGEQGGMITGFAYAGRWRARSAYRASAETSIYLDPGQVGHGHGRRLYEAMLTKLEEKGMHAAIGGIALPNEASIALHEKLGFEKVAHFREVGYKFNRWIDVGYWQRLF